MLTETTPCLRDADRRRVRRNGDLGLERHALRCQERAHRRRGGTRRRACSPWCRRAARSGRTRRPSMARSSGPFVDLQVAGREVARGRDRARAEARLQADRRLGGRRSRRAGRPRHLVDEVLELHAALLEAGRVHVGQVVRHVVDVGLLRRHPARRRVECSNHDAPRSIARAWGPTPRARAAALDRLARLAGPQVAGPSARHRRQAAFEHALPSLQPRPPAPIT